MRTRSSRGSPLLGLYVPVWSLVMLGLSLVVGAGRAAALPSYSWQTGLPCTQCHVQGFGPDLTDFGRQFKLNGYVWGDRPIYARISCKL